MTRNESITMKKIDKPEMDDLRQEYDPSKMTGMVRGKYADRFKAGMRISLP